MIQSPPHETATRDSHTTDSDLFSNSVQTMPDPDNTTKRTVDEITHQSDPTCVTTPSPDALPSRAPRGTTEVLDLVVRKGPLSFDQLMRTHLSELSRSDAFVALKVLQEMGYVDRVTALTEPEHGITQNMWYVPSDHNPSPRDTEGER